MKSYGQFCALARALDVVGDRWTLLIIRELLIGPCRYSDLQRSLPGIASNLLADRLQVLQEHGLVLSEEAPAPVSARVYSLTDRGRGLRAVLIELAHWGVPYMAEGADGDRSRGRWLAFAVLALFPSGDDAPDELLPELTVRIEAEGDQVLLVASGGGVDAHPCAPHTPADVVLAGSSEEVFATLSGYPADGAVARASGDEGALARFSDLVLRAVTNSGNPS